MDNMIINTTKGNRHLKGNLTTMLFLTLSWRSASRWEGCMLLLLTRQP